MQITGQSIRGRKCQSRCVIGLESQMSANAQTAADGRHNSARPATALFVVRMLYFIDMLSLCTWQFSCRGYF